MSDYLDALEHARQRDAWWRREDALTTERDQLRAALSAVLSVQDKCDDCDSLALWFWLHETDPGCDFRCDSHKLVDDRRIFEPVIGAAEYRTAIALLEAKEGGR